MLPRTYIPPSTTRRSTRLHPQHPFPQQIAPAHVLDLSSLSHITQYHTHMMSDTSSARPRALSLGADARSQDPICPPSIPHLPNTCPPPHILNLLHTRLPTIMRLTWNIVLLHTSSTSKKSTNNVSTSYRPSSDPYTRTHHVTPCPSITKTTLQTLHSALFLSPPFLSSLPFLIFLPSHSPYSFHLSHSSPPLIAISTTLHTHPTLLPADPSQGLRTSQIPWTR